MACGSGCCGGSKPQVEEPDAAKTQQAPNSTQAECPEPPPAAELVSQDETNTGSGIPEEIETPSCCKDKSSPCCDASCLLRLALRACKDDDKDCESGGQEETLQEGSGDGATVRTPRRRAKKRSPCNYHARKTRETYATTLEALGCICRALLALGQESCCAKNERSSVDRKRRSASSSWSSSSSSSSLHALQKTSPDFCCSTATPSQTVPRLRARDSSSGFKNACCGKPQPSPVVDSCSKGCCDKQESLVVADDVYTEECRARSPATVVKESCSRASFCNPKTAAKAAVPRAASKGCCSDPSSPPNSLGIAYANGPDISSIAADIEKGYSDREHIVLSVSGMTCSGCESKLQLMLNKHPAVNNLKTSLVLSRAEFELDLKAGSVDEVMRHIERTTEFKCEKVQTQGFRVDLTVPNAADFVASELPKGVTDVTAVDRTTVQVTYDPSIVGARDLCERLGVELAPLRPDQTVTTSKKHVQQILYMTLLSTILTIPVLVMAFAPLPNKETRLDFAYASLVLATLVQIIIAGPFYPTALKALVFARVIEMDLLIVLSTTAAYIFSVVSFGYLVAGSPLSTGSFFETSTLLVTLIMVGRYAAALARQKAVESISVRSLQASTAILVEGERGDKEIDLRLLQFGDVFKVAPESKIPTDGTVISGVSEVDESMITGESRPVEKRAGSTLIAGTINGSGTLLARVARLPGDNTIDTIAGMVDQAKLTKPKMQQLADRVASRFVPVIVGLMVITLVTWIGVGVSIRKLPASEAAIQALTYAITVLIVSCPCAIGLAVPMVIVIATGVGAKHGVVFKSAESIEVAYKTSHVILDKTGTLTEGKLAVVFVDHAGDEETVKRSASLLLGMVEGIRHPVSVALAAYLKENGTVAAEVLGTKSIPGKGLEATLCSGEVLRAGNSRWLGLETDARVQPLLAQGHTVFCFAINGDLLSVFGLQDSIRADTFAAIRALHERSISVHVLSGDDDGAVRLVTGQLQIPEANVRSRCTPGDKQEYTQEILNRPGNPVVIFCGDGTNDAVALAQATVGIAINRDESTGADVAKSAADVVLMRPDLGGILTVIKLSKKAVYRIFFNFAWSFVYNLFAVLLAAGAFVNARISPEYAGLGELVSVLPVIGAAWALKWERI